MSVNETLNRLARSATDRKIAGVCGGFAAGTRTPVWLWRAGFVLWAICGGTGLIAYLLCWIFMPKQG